MHCFLFVLLQVSLKKYLHQSGFQNASLYHTDNVDYKN